MLITLTIVFLVITITSRVGTKIRKAFADLESLPTAPAQAEMPSVEEVSEQGPYFSYEQEMVETAFQTVDEPSRKPMTAPVVAAVPAPAYQNTVDFDLRQAVIYQTILHNPYWTESRQ